MRPRHVDNVDSLPRHMNMNNTMLFEFTPFRSARVAVKFDISQFVSCACTAEPALSRRIQAILSSAPGNKLLVPGALVPAARVGPISISLEWPSYPNRLRNRGSIHGQCLTIDCSYCSSLAYTAIALCRHITGIGSTH